MSLDIAPKVLAGLNIRAFEVSAWAYDDEGKTAISLVDSFEEADGIGVYARQSNGLAVHIRDFDIDEASEAEALADMLAAMFIRPDSPFEVVDDRDGKPVTVAEVLERHKDFYGETRENVAPGYYSFAADQAGSPLIVTDGVIPMAIRLSAAFPQYKVVWRD